MDLGTYIQQLRKERGISQESLAEQVGVSRQAVGKWEQGLSYPSTENLLALAQIFGVSADTLIGMTPAAPAPKKAFSPLWLIPLALLCLIIGWCLPHPAAQAPEPSPTVTPAPELPQSNQNDSVETSPLPEQEQEEVDDARAAYIAWNSLTSDPNLLAEETYRLRLELFSYLPSLDWHEFGMLGEAGKEFDTILALMRWLREQETLSETELTGVLLGGAGDLDGAFSEAYADVLTNAFILYPDACCRILAQADLTEDKLGYIVGGIAYGAYPEDVWQQAMDAAESVSGIGTSMPGASMEIAAMIRARLIELPPN